MSDTDANKISTVINSHLLSSQSDHVQGAVHEAAHQSLGPIFGGDDIIHPVIRCDVLQFTTKGSNASIKTFKTPTF